jgi:TatA/E family protein of Tat protein translocase
MGGLSIWHWLIALGVIALIFGTAAPQSVRGDVGVAFRKFKRTVFNPKPNTVYFWLLVATVPLLCLFIISEWISAR